MTPKKFYEHPEFTARKLKWIEYRDLNEGEHDKLVSPTYLHMHEFESNKVKGGDKLRAIREMRTEYTNYLRPVINRYCSLVFRNAIDTKDVEQVFGDDIKNVDGQGNSLENFLKTVVAPCFFLNGKAAILTDSFGVEAKSRAEEQAAGLRPYFELVQPLNMPAWAFVGEGNAFERYLWVRTETDILEPWLDPATEPGVFRYSKVYRLENGRLVVDVYKGHEVNKKITTDTSFELVRTQPIGIADIPIASLDKESWMKDVVPKARQLFNLESALDNQLNFQGYQRAFACGPIKEGDEVVMNEAGLVTFPEGTSVQVVEPTNPVALMNRINGVTATLFQIAFYRTRVLPSDAKAIESSDNQREAKEEFLACIINAATQLEGLANQAIKHYAAFKGMSDFEGEVKLDKDISVEDWDQFIGSVTAFYSDIKSFPTWYKSTMKKVATQQSPADIDEIAAEIDAGAAPQPAQERGAMFREALGATEQQPEAGSDAEPRRPS